jgi:hypothetical protein
MQTIGEIFKNREVKKAPAYAWQDFALKIIEELAIPNFKRNSVFKICKEYDRAYIEKCFDDTKELAKGSEKWKYFFKLVSQNKKQP